MLFLAMLSFSAFSQTTNKDKSTHNPKAPVNYNINATLGGDNVEASLKIELVGDNFQVHRNIGSNQWNYQWFDWSDHPGRGVHLYVNGNFYYVNSSTDIYVDGVPDGSSLSYYEDSDGIPFERLDIEIEDEYNATLKLTKIGVLEAFVTIYYPPESDYINFTWEITNTSNSDLSDLRFYQGGDTYSYGSDYGRGYWDETRNTVGCEKEVSGETVYVLLQALETPYQHESAQWGWYSGVESHVMQNALTGEVRTDDHDNAIALEWRKETLGVDETWELNTVEKYSNRDMTNLIVSAPYNQTIYQNETKYIEFNVRNASLVNVQDISLEKAINKPGWTIDIAYPVGNFDLAANEDIDVIVSLHCPLEEIPGTIAQATLQASADDETANDKAYIEVLSIAPTFLSQPEDYDICDETESATFSVETDNAQYYSWEKNSGSFWDPIIDNAIISGSTTRTLVISDATGLLGTSFRCIILDASGTLTETSEPAQIILDQTPPVPDALVLPDVIDVCEVLTIAPPTATDFCEGEIIGTTDAVFPITDSTTIVWSFEDSQGNISFIQQDVIINDNEGPIPDVENLLTPVASCTNVITAVPTASDNCSDEVIEGTTEDPLGYDQEGTYMVTWTYEDNSGNITTQTQSIVVKDDLPVTETKDTTLTLANESDAIAVITPEDINDGSWDDCGIDSMYLDRTTFTAEDAGENIVTLTVVDYAGNDSSKTAIVTILLDYEIQIPNFVSPDNDGVNDLWEIKGVEKLQGFTLDIFNKIGENIYHTENYDNTWDATFNGKELPDATYYYIFKSANETYSGYISVIR